ncbi:M1 family aminopeptidase, partial [Thermoflexus hugenholtzii]
GAACAIGFALGVLAGPALVQRLPAATAPAPEAATPATAVATPRSRPSPTLEAEAFPTRPPTPTRTGSPIPSRADLPEPPPEPDWTVGLAPSERNAGVDRRPIYRIGGVLEPDRGRLRGRLILSFPYQEGPSLSALCFRVWAHAPSSGSSRLEVGEVRVGDRSVRPAWSGDRTAFTVTLPVPLRAGGEISLEMPFTVTVGSRAGGYGLLQKTPDGLLVLYYGYPELARIREGRCVLDPPWENGDLHQAEAAHFALRLRLPEGTALSASGVIVQEASGPPGWREVEIVAPYVRNLVLVAGEMEEIVRERNGVRVRGFFRKAGAREARRAVEDALDALERFGEAFGPYPFSELDLVEVPLRGGAAGVEAGGLIMIGEDVFGMGDLSGMLGGTSGGLDLPGFVVAHEVAHQWWYGMVGNDAHREPWLDEALTNWSSAFWVEKARGPEAAQATWDLLVLLPYRLRLAEKDLPLNLPTDDYSMLDYAAIVYGKGAWMMEVLRREMGEERFFAFLRRYLEKHRWGWATGESWRETLGEVWGKERAEAFFEKWVAGDGITSKDLPPSEFGALFEDPSLGPLLRTLLEALMQAQP